MYKSVPHPPAALLSLTEKKGALKLAQSLSTLGYKILASGGTYEHLSNAGLEVMRISSVTNFPEILDGRVKTLHPLIFGSLLYDRNDDAHLKTQESYGLINIKVLAVNFYEFGENQSEFGDFGDQDLIRGIDVGGPSMLRAAAKNFIHITTLSHPDQYERALKELTLNGDTSLEFRKSLAAQAFRLCSSYDAQIALSLGSGSAQLDFSSPKIAALPATELRYGENPHQRALYSLSQANPSTELPLGLSAIQGKPLSYNNIRDLESSLQLLDDFEDTPTLSIVKHNQPCGLATQCGASGLQLYNQAYTCDPTSAFGGIVTLNISVDEALAQALGELFLECIVAPSFEPEALVLLSRKKHLRLLTRDFKISPYPAYELRSLGQGWLWQEPDRGPQHPDLWTWPTEHKPEPRQRKDLYVALKVAKHLKSNAIAIVREGQTLGLSGGQTSRIEAAMAAIDKAKRHFQNLRGAVLASDAFFPFADVIQSLEGTGISAIVQPGGSIRDKHSIEAADQLGIPMGFCGDRHFRH